MRFIRWHETLPNSNRQNALRVITRSADQTSTFGTRCAPLLRGGDVVLLTGDLGAGKTQFAQGVARGLEVEEPVISPTFNILLVHRGSDVELDHWDLYRLERHEELVDIDYFAQVAGDAISLVEWGDKFADTLIDADLDLCFTRIDDQTRSIEVRAHSQRGEELIAMLAATRKTAEESSIS